MKTKTLVAANIVALFSLLLAACGGGATAAPPSTGAAAQSLLNSAPRPAVLTQSQMSQSAPEDMSPDQSAAGGYCAHTGGVVETRRAYYGTNGSNPLALAGAREFCRYTAKDGSSIHLLLTTLYTKQPTLAVLAYLAKVPLDKTCAGNPASCYCTKLGGTDLFGGINFEGGGWVRMNARADVLEACIFPDMSSIDSWGLAYHSAGIIRGADLTNLVRYKKPT